jgi:hypothetical protein
MKKVKTKAAPPAAFIAHVRKVGFRELANGHLPRKVPDGKVLVHNHARHSKYTRTWTNGFRAWTQTSKAGLIPCDCGWSGLPHYCVDPDKAASFLPKKFHAEYLTVPRRMKTNRLLAPKTPKRQKKRITRLRPGPTRHVALRKLDAFAQGAVTQAKLEPNIEPIEIAGPVEPINVPTPVEPAKAANDTQVKKNRILSYLGAVFGWLKR